MEKTPVLDHRRLVERGASWLKRQGFCVVATELSTAATREVPDVIGFRSTCSAVIEAKMSRRDFMRDRHKPHRTVGGLGLYRLFICPIGVISATELPSGWGLLYVCGRSVQRVVAPIGNMWPPAGTEITGWAQFQHDVDPYAEMRVLYSIARRLSLRKATYAV